MRWCCVTGEVGKGDMGEEGRGCWRAAWLLFRAPASARAPSCALALFVRVAPVMPDPTCAGCLVAWRALALAGTPRACSPSTCRQTRTRTRLSPRRRRCSMPSCSWTCVGTPSTLPRVARQRARCAQATCPPRIIVGSAPTPTERRLACANRARTATCTRNRIFSGPTQSWRLRPRRHNAPS